jgi:Ca2+-binding RTX toxin-like protein
LRNNVFANSPSGGNCNGLIIDGGGNLSDDGSCGFTDPTSMNNTPAGLDPAGLQDNGGPTETIALVAGSAAMDMGLDTICAAAPVNNLDQRGFVRPVDGDDDSTTVCDIGAFEFGATAPALTCNGLPVTIMGTAGNDNLVGTNGNDVIHGVGGNDNIAAGNGNDTVCGGDGNDTVLGGSGNDTLLGEGGHDNLRGGNGSDSLNGGADADTCSGGAGTDTATPECELVGGVP